MTKVLKDVVMYWAQVHTPVLKYKTLTNAKEYTLTCLLTKETVMELKGLKPGLNKQFKRIDDDPKLLAKYPEYADRFEVKFTQNEVSSKGKALSVDVIDKKGKPITGDIGNGSSGQVKLFFYEYDSSLIVRLNAVMVSNLVEYTGTKSDDDEGFDFDSDTSGFDTDTNDNMDDDDVPF
jgi:hypothetical protein